MAVRTKMRKEVTHTIVKAKRIIIDEEGNTKTEPVEDITLLGRRTKEQAQRIVRKEYGESVTVFNVESNTATYEMEVQKFIELAEVVTPKEDEEDEEESK